MRQRQSGFSMLPRCRRGFSMPPRHRRGFSMVEMAIVLGVVGLVMGGVWTLAVKVQQTARVQQAVEQVIAVNKNIRSYYQSQPCIPTGNQTAVLTGLPGQNIFPREMLGGGGVVDLWNGGVQVLGVDGACGYLFQLSFLALPAATCAELVPKLTASSEASRGLVAASINGTPLQALPPNPAAIIGAGAGQCNVAATAAVTLNYKLRVSD